MPSNCQALEAQGGPGRQGAEEGKRKGRSFKIGCERQLPGENAKVTASWLRTKPVLDSALNRCTIPLLMWTCRCTKRIPQWAKPKAREVCLSLEVTQLVSESSGMLGSLGGDTRAPEKVMPRLSLEGHDFLYRSLHLHRRCLPGCVWISRRGARDRSRHTVHGDVPPT